MAEHADAADPELIRTSLMAEEPQTNETENRAQKRISREWPAATVGVAAILAPGGLTGWFSYQTIQARKLQQQRNSIVEVARQYGVNHFHDDFQQRS